MKANKFKRNRPFDIPKKPDTLELMIGWFFDQIRMIVDSENHRFKFDGGNQILDILYDSALDENVNIGFSWDEDTHIWYIELLPTVTYLGATVRPETNEDDILNLPLVAFRFSRIYRLHAYEYFHPEDRKKIDKIKEIMKGAKNGREK
jgi:hypothetical protein